MLREIIKKEGAEQARRYDRTECKFSVIAVVKGDEEQDTVILAAVFGRIISYIWHEERLNLY